MKYELTEAAARDLREPWGRPLSVEEIQAGFPGRRIATVGDMVTYTYITNNKKAPALMIFDLITERKPYEVLDEAMKKVCKFRVLIKNPPSVLMNETIREVENAMTDIISNRKKRVAIQVVGEEDLLALPVLIMSEDNWSIIYGVPGVGMNIIDSNKEMRKKAADTLLKMRMV